MPRVLYLVKVIIRNFRSIREVHLNNIGDVTVLVGPNESGKSNILKALKWFGTDTPLESDDIPMDLQVSGEKINHPIVEAYFEVSSREKFEEMFNLAMKREIQKILGDYPFEIGIADPHKIITELGLTPFTLEGKFINNGPDIVCKDKEGNLVVLELKRRRADLHAVNQLKRYVDALKEKHENVRGILIAPSLTAGAKKLLEEEGFEFKEFMTSTMVPKNIKFLKLEKYDNGQFIADLYDANLNSVLEEFAEILKISLLNVSLSDLFVNTFKSEVEKVLKSNGIPSTEIPNGIKIIKDNPNFLNTINSAVKESETIDNKDRDKDIIKRFDEAKQNLHQILQKAPNTNINLTINGRTLSLNPRTIFINVYNQLILKINKLENLMKANEFKKIIQSAVVSLRPDFIYLSEEMELKGKVVKQGKWSQVLNEEKGDYVINARLFRILKIDLKEFEKKDEDNQERILKNKLFSFSNNLKHLWKQQRIQIDATVREKSISFHIIEVDENNNPIPGKATSPEVRSRGFKWYLAYLITLEYLKIKGEEKDIVLLLDDPGVFLHERGQKDFLKTINEVSKNVQILYNTHLISLFDERELDRVLLVQLDKENRTTIQKPWTNKKKDIIAPIRYALGFDKLIFDDFIEKFDGILFVEGISDKFIFEGLQKAGVLPEKWYIYPLSGGDGIDKNEIVKRIEQLECLYGRHDNKLKHYFVLDGDKRQEFRDTKDEEKKKTEKEIHHKEKKKDYELVFLGNENQEIEDLIDKEFYLKCVSDCYFGIFIHAPSKMKKLNNAIKSVMEKKDQEKITKLLDEEFKKYGLGDFSKVDVSKTIKRKLSKDPSLVEYLQPVINELKDHGIIQK